MGLLDSLVGSALGGASANAEGGLNPAMLAQLLPAATQLLGNDGEHGGLGGLVSQLSSGGLGSAVQSWIGSGANQAISGEQLSNALGGDTLNAIAERTGLPADTLASGLAQVLPHLVNHLTPDGQAPAEGVGSSADLMGSLGGLLGQLGQGGQGGAGSLLGGLASAFLKS